MNYLMTEERRKIVRRYIFDMINLFVDDLVTGMFVIWIRHFRRFRSIHPTSRDFFGTSVTRIATA